MAGKIPGLCISENPRTGLDRCPKREGKSIALIITELGARFPMETTEVNAALVSAVTTATTNRAYPINGIQGIELAGGEVATSDVGFSGTLPVSLEAYQEIYRIDGSDCLYKELVKFNKRHMRVFRIDDENYCYGTTKTANGTEYFVGYECYLYVRSVRGIGTEDYQLYLTVYYTANYENEKRDMNAVALTEIPEGLVAVTLQKVTGGVQVVSACSGVDYTTTFGEDWIASMFIDNEGKAATGVTFNQATGLLTITPAGTYRLAGAAILQAGGITGLDGISETVSI